LRAASRKYRLVTRRLPTISSHTMPLETLRKMVRVIKRIERTAKENDLSVGTTASILVGLYEARTGKLAPYKTVKKRLGP
jgi:hypothetical protein